MNAIAAPQPAPRAAPLAECLVLAALLHLLAVALFGSAPGGTARPGEGVWGAINVRLAGNGPPRNDAELPPPEVDSGAPGTAATQRWGGVVRDTSAPPPAAQPGTARLGTWSPARTPGNADPLPPALAQPTVPTTQPVATPAPAPLPETAPEAAPDAPAAPAPEPALRALRDSSSVLREITPLASTAPLLPVAPAAPVTPPPDFVPLLQPPAPVVTRTLQAPAPLPAAAALPPLQPVQRVQAAEALAAPAPALQAVPQAPSPRGVPQLRPAEPAGTPRATQTLPPRPSLGAPDAGAAIGHDVATPPSATASQPRLNLDLARPRGGELSPLGSRGVVNLLPVPPELKSKFGEDILKSARPDCRTAYSGAGIAAAVPLVADALRKDGCRW